VLPYGERRIVVGNRGGYDHFGTKRAEAASVVGLADAEPGDERRKRPSRDARRSGTARREERFDPEGVERRRSKHEARAHEQLASLGWPAKVIRWPRRPSDASAGHGLENVTERARVNHEGVDGSLAMALYYPRNRLTNRIACGIVRSPTYA